jgi:hypothetical protein
MFTYYLKDKYTKLFVIYCINYFRLKLYCNYIYNKINSKVIDKFDYKILTINKILYSKILFNIDSLIISCSNDENNINKYDYLPYNLKKLNISKYYIIIYDMLDALKSNTIIHDIPYKLNIKLKVLTVNGLFNTSDFLKDVKNLRKLVLYNSYNGPLNLLEFTNLKYLNLCDSFNSDLYLPSSLEILYFGFNFNQNIDNLPDSIEELEITSVKFKQIINKLPKSLKYLVITRNATINCSLKDIEVRYIDTY